MICQTKTGIYAAQNIDYLLKKDSDRIALSGVDAEYYSLNRGTNIDSLYNEPDNDPLYGGMDSYGSSQRHNTAWNFSPDVTGGESPLVVSCIVEYVEYENRNPSVRDEGFEVESDAIMSLSRHTWECSIENLELPSLAGRVPKEGDVVYVFDQWWDVVKAGKSGNVRGTNIAVGYKLDLKRREKFVPERKIPE